MFRGVKLTDEEMCREAAKAGAVGIPEDPVADSVVLTLINKRMLQPDDFTEPEANH